MFPFASCSTFLLTLDQPEPPRLKKNVSDSVVLPTISKPPTKLDKIGKQTFSTLSTHTLM